MPSAHCQLTTGTSRLLDGLTRTFVGYFCLLLGTRGQLCLLRSRQAQHVADISARHLEVDLQPMAGFLLVERDYNRRVLVKGGER